MFCHKGRPVVFGLTQKMIVHYNTVLNSLAESTISVFGSIVPRFTVVWFDPSSSALTTFCPFSVQYNLLHIRTRTHNSFKSASLALLQKSNQLQKANALPDIGSITCIKLV